MKSVIDGASKLNIQVSETQANTLIAYRDALLVWNEKVNVTGITNPEEFNAKHIVDSLSALLAIPSDAKTLIDVGTGGGFPGIALKVARPEMQVTLLDSVAKKARIVEEIANSLSIECEILAARAEEVGQQPDYREQYDVAIARAVALLPIMLEYLLPLVRIGGIAIAMKIANDAEIESATNALKVLGGKLKTIIPIELEGLPTRHLLVIEKIAETPKEYPRTSGVPASKPL